MVIKSELHSEPVLVTFQVCSNRAEGTLPKALRAIAAQNVRVAWECLLVDNGFSPEDATKVQALAESCFPKGRFRMVKERTQGLGYARRRGFQAAHGHWVVMVDDDNYVDPNFAEELAHLLEKFPDVGGVGPCVYPLFPQPEQEGFRRIAHRCLSVTEDVLASLGEMPRYYPPGEAKKAPRPPGGGMVIRREIGMAWAEDALKNNSLDLDRTGTKLTSAGDAEIWRVLMSLRVPVVLSDHLRIAHDLPGSRFKWCYLWRLNYWMAWSYVWLDLSEGSITAPSSSLGVGVQSLRHLKLIVGAKTLTERLDRWMDWASFLGAQAARRAFQSSGVRRGGKVAITLANETNVQPNTKRHEY